MIYDRGIAPKGHKMAQQGSDTEGTAPRVPAAIPDVYVDATKFEASSYTVTLALGMAAGTGVVRPAATVRMSHTHAKVFAIILTRFLKQTEQTLEAPIPIPKRVLEEMGISLDEDW